MTEKDKAALTPCWYLKDYADGWIKFYDVDCAIQEAVKTGAVLRYSEDGSYPKDRAALVPAAGVEVEELREAVNRLTGIPAMYGFSEPIEGYLERPQDLERVMHEMGKAAAPEPEKAQGDDSAPDDFKLLGEYLATGKGYFGAIAALKRVTAAFETVALASVAEGNPLDVGVPLPRDVVNAWKKPLVEKAWRLGVSGRTIGQIFDLSHETVYSWMAGVQRDLSAPPAVSPADAGEIEAVRDDVLAHLSRLMDCTVRYAAEDVSDIFDEAIKRNKARASLSAGQGVAIDTDEILRDWYKQTDLKVTVGEDTVLRIFMRYLKNRLGGKNEASL